MDYVFVHGGMQGGWIWDETLEAMRTQAADEVGKVLVFDIPGCGTKRGRDTDALAFEEIITELAAEVRASGVRDALLVGHSQAGTVMPRLLEKAPDLFRRAVYVTCCAPLPGQTLAQMLGTSRHGTHPDEVGWPADRELGFDKLFPLMFCNDMTADEQAAFMARLGRDKWPAAYLTETDWRYGGAPTPSTFVVCLDDGILPVEWQLRFADRLGAETRVDIQAGHQVMNTRPHALAEVLRFEGRR